MEQTTMKKPMLEGLLGTLEMVITNVNWDMIAEESSMEKQIEIRAELNRVVKRIEKELKNGN